MLLESELRILELLWNEGDLTASELITELERSLDWSDTTILQIIRTCIVKGFIERLGSNFICRAIITKEEIKKRELEMLADKVVGGFSDLLVASLLDESKMSPSQVNKLREMVQEFAAEQQWM